MCLQTVLLRNNKEKLIKEERDFENLLFLHRPEVYQEYIKEKEEQEKFGFDHIEWKQPETLEELEMIMSAIRITDNDNQEFEQQNQEEDNSVEQQFLSMFDGIDISQLGEEDG